LNEPARERSGFYRRTLERLLEAGVVDRGMSVLVVAGDTLDRDVLHAAGFEDVTISNLGEARADEYAPYRFLTLDAEALALPNETVDLAVTSAGLHHCRSPHRALLELYRVARRATLALEARDSLLIRLAARLGAADDYELAAVAAHAFRAGGVRNTSIPNFVFRWTEREVEKTVAAHAPWARHRILYFHELEIPESIVAVRSGAVGRLAARAATPALRLLTRVVPGQANLFAFAVLKPELPRDLQPWIRLSADGPMPDEDWIRRRLRLPS
jgi:SAM-dependent methyltransferase